MKFLHLSRERAEAYRGREPYALISMTDPGSQPANLETDAHRAAVLRLQFHDINESLEHLHRLGYTSHDLRDYVLPDITHAREIVRFFRSLPPEVELVITHCEAGISRSAAVAHALSYVAGEPYRPLVGSQFSPNKRLVRLIQLAWEEDGE